MDGLSKRSISSNLLEMHKGPEQAGRPAMAQLKSAVCRPRQSPPGGYARTLSEGATCRIGDLAPSTKSSAEAAIAAALITLRSAFWGGQGRIKDTADAQQAIAPYPKAPTS
jgi:hypothetical protein